MGTLDGSIVNVALPVMSKELAVSIQSIQWVVTAYLLTVSIMLLICGKLSDIYGKKYIYAAGFFIFSLGSILCSISHSLVILVISRVIQALGASAMMSLSAAIVTATFPPSERGKALGFVGAMVALGSLLGPSLGGLLGGSFGWQSIFIINIPIGFIGFIGTIIFVPEVSEKPQIRTLDIKGALLFAFTIILLYLGLLFTQQGVIPVIYLIPVILVSLLGFIAFVRVEKKAVNPLLSLGLFRIQEFSFGLASAFLCFISMSAAMLFLPFYLQNVLHLSSLKAGFVLSTSPITMAILSPISGRLSDRITFRPLTIAGMGLATTALLFGTFINASTGIVQIVVLLTVFGFGNAIFQSPNNSSIMGSVPRSQLGIAGGTNALFRNLGMVSGTTLSVFIFSFVTNIKINSITGGFDVGRFISGLTVIFIFGAVCTFGSMLICLARGARSKKHYSG